MKTLKWLNVLIALVICLAFLPVRPVHAAQVISIDTIWASPDHVTLTQDVVITNGATLMIDDGRDVTVNCTDAGHYPSGADPNRIEIIVEDGTLLANEVTFHGAAGGSCWFGIRVMSEGFAWVTNSTIRNARFGVYLFQSDGVISGNTIQDIRGADQTLGGFPAETAGIVVVEGDPGIEIENNIIASVTAGSGCDGTSGCTGNNGVNAYGIWAMSTNDLLISGNQISTIRGGDGGNGEPGVDGADGADGNASVMHGQPGAPGTNGADGGSGGEAHGIYLVSTTGVVEDNQISQINGGWGEVGGVGGYGGDGGVGYSQPGPFGGYPADGGFGGNGGAGGDGGAGGNGGDAAGISVFFSTLSVTDNTIQDVYPGAGVIGGQGKDGGRGGGGGVGSPVVSTPSIIVGGYGGGGGIGGAGGHGGSGGQAGTGYGIYLHLGAVTELSGNVVDDVLGIEGGSGVAGSPGARGGYGGRGGLGTISYPYGGGGGDAGPNGKGGDGGDSADGGSVYGLFLDGISVSLVEGNRISGLSAGAGRPGAGGATSTGIGGASGGATGGYPAAGVSAGDGGEGSSGGAGGDGSDSGIAAGIYILNPGQNVALVNNLVYDVVGKSGGNGGGGGNGTTGGTGGTGGTRPGGDGGDGGDTGSGGEGGTSQNAYGIWVETSVLPAVTANMVNNTLVTITASEVEPEGGLRGATPGAGGAGGTGTPAGTAGQTGALGAMGLDGWQGYALGVYAGPGVTATLYNNIIVSYESPLPGNSLGVARQLGGAVTTSQHGNVWGWAFNIQSGLTPDTTGSISADPQFVNLSGDNYQLQPASPCVNTGLNSAPGLPAVDLDGVARLLGAHVDMGVYEMGSYYRFLAASLAEDEADLVLEIAVEQVGRMSSSGTVTVGCQDVSAENGVDYQCTGSTLDFAAGTGSQVLFSVTLLDDDLPEDDETFQILLTNPVGGGLMAPQTLVVTIQDTDGVLVYLPLVIR